MKSYQIASSEDLDILTDILQDEEYGHLVAYNIRIGLVFVTNSSNSGETKPAFTIFGQPTPSKVKLVNAKDRIFKKLDVEILIDEFYWASSDDREKHAIIEGALSQLEISEKSGVVNYNDDGTVKLKLKKPDMVFIGNSKIAEKYRSSSPEMKAFMELKTEFSNILL